MPSETVKIHNELVASVATAPLSQIFPMALQLAHTLNNEEFKKWILLEYNGYFNTNPALTDDVLVPEYRSVVGQHYDEFDRVLLIEDSDLCFVNQSRLRNGIAELEDFSNKTGLLTIRDSKMINSINEYLKIKVCLFKFSPTEVATILTSIRSKLIEWLAIVKEEVGQIDTIEDINPPKLSKNTPSNVKARLEIIAAVLTIIASSFGIYAYYSNSNKSDKPLSMINTSVSSTKNTVDDDSNHTIIAPTQNVNVSYSNGGINHVTPKGSTIVIENNKSKTEAATHNPSKQQKETLTALKAEFKNQYPDIDLCDAEDRQKNVAKYRQAYALIQEIKGIASKLNDTPSIIWVNEITCNGIQKSGGIQRATNLGGSP